MQRYCHLALCAVLMITLLAGCGGNSPARDGLGPDNGVQVGVAESAAGSEPAQISAGGGLPALTALPQPRHEVSLLGPGWENLPYRAIISSKGNSIGSGGTLNLGLGG